LAIMNLTLSKYPLIRMLLLGVLSAAPLSAQVIPVNLSAPSDKPVDKTKPVKVFIQSGQSNSLGFGKLEGAKPLYSSIFHSADPSAIACKMPVGESALIPLNIYQSAEPNAEKGGIAHHYASLEIGKPIPSDAKPSNTQTFALGSVAEQIPSASGVPFQVVKTYLEVAHAGTYEVHAGMGDSSHCAIHIDGTKVYEKALDATKATLTKIKLDAGKRYEVVINFYKSGSAAFWMEQVDLEGKGDLRWIVEKLGRFPYMQDDKGEWTVRNDVMLNDAYMGKGQSAPLSAKACGPTFGPELGFGFVLGEYLDEPVIVMKADIGNRSLGWDILPPGSESYTFDGKLYPGYGETLSPDGKIVKPGPTDWYAGKQYDDFTASIRNVLDNFGKHYPQYAEQGFEVAGFVWWQGHKDGPNPAHNARYEQNLVNLIKAWRKEFNAPKANWAIATVGFHGENMIEEYKKIAQAQLNVADPKLHPELAGTVKTIDTRPFWREPELSPINQDYHYNHNAETYMLTGDALGRAMVELLGGKVEYPSAAADKNHAGVPFMLPPTEEEIASMTNAFKPIILDSLLPKFVSSSDGIPSYRRGGIELKNMIKNVAPAQPRNVELTSQLDQVISFYNLVGENSYDWKSFGPEMQTANWHYHTFDPKEKAPKDAKGNVGDMYREITLPAGMENWFATDFDTAKAGWKTGAAPFGMKDGKKEPLIASCKVPHCGCNHTPGTLWDKEVLLMRQTFEIPDFKADHRYRIIVGGSGHQRAGEGFALYLNGKLVSEAKGGYYKGGGAARGAYVFEDIKPEFKDGKATFAVKAFLRQTGFRGVTAPAQGNLSVWMQEAKLPPLVLAQPAEKE
jgi:hypothetical protein